MKTIRGRLNAFVPLALGVILSASALVSDEDLTTRCQEGVSRVVGNLDVISSASNDTAVRRYFSAQTREMFTSAEWADDGEAVAIVDPSGERHMTLSDFLGYIDGRSDSIPCVLGVEIPVSSGDSIGTDSILSAAMLPAAVMNCEGLIISAPDSCRMLPVCWDMTIRGAVAVPKFGRMTVEMKPVINIETVERYDTINHRIFPVFRHSNILK
ncbi:MAG: hypothetical protein K2K55_06445 [Duncaniella sp.]|nr:hypothetical protein [Duncaniella sp.]